MTGTANLPALDPGTLGAVVAALPDAAAAIGRDARLLAHNEKWRRAAGGQFDPAGALALHDFLEAECVRALMAVPVAPSAEVAAFLPISWHPLGSAPLQMLVLRARLQPSPVPAACLFVLRPPPTREIELEAAVRRARQETEAAQTELGALAKRLSPHLEALAHASWGDAYLHPRATAAWTVVQRVLDLRELAEGRLQVRRTPYDLRAAVAPVLAEQRAAAEAKGLSFGEHWGELPPGRVLGDPVRVAQMLGCLVENAVAFTGAGLVAVTVDGHEEAADRWLMRVTVRDTGPGLPTDTQARLGGRGLVRRPGGYGLALSRQLAERLGGSLSLQSTPGAGSTVAVTFRAPLAEPSPARSPAAPEAGPELTALRVLLVDDNPVNLELCAARLRPLGHHLTLADSGEAAVEACAAGVFDLVLMDVQMPGIDGFEATRRIRAAANGRRPRPQIHALSALDGPELTEKALAAGMDGTLAKPFTLDAFMAVTAGLRLAPAPPPGPAAAPPAPSPAPPPPPPPAPAPARPAATEPERPRGGPPKLPGVNLARVASIFLKKTPGDLDKLRAAWEQRDFRLLNHVAHSVKGAVAIFGAEEARATAAEIEAAAKRNDPGPMEAAVPLLADQVADLCARLRTQYPEAG